MSERLTRFVSIEDDPNPEGYLLIDKRHPAGNHSTRSKLIQVERTPHNHHLFLFKNSASPLPTMVHDKPIPTERFQVNYQHSETVLGILQLTEESKRIGKLPLLALFDVEGHFHDNLALDGIEQNRGSGESRRHMARFIRHYDEHELYVLIDDIQCVSGAIASADTDICPPARLIKKL